LFSTRVDLIGELQNLSEDHGELLDSLKSRLLDEVRGMNLDNFIVRAKRRAVETFQDDKNWAALDLDARITLQTDIAGLPSAYRDDALPAKQFDLLMLNAQLCLLRGESSFAALQARIIRFASALERLANVPAVVREMELILEIQTDDFWKDITVDILESIRKRLRMLVDLIEPIERKVVITDFEDEIGSGDAVDLPEIGGGVDKARFKLKMRRFIEAHADHLALQKIRRAIPITQQDLTELEAMMLGDGAADTDVLATIRSSGGLGLFLRQLVGLDRAAAKDAFSEFVTAQKLNANQTEFINLIIDCLTETGTIEPGLFYESPFTDISDQGITGVFSREQGSDIIRIVAQLNTVAAA
jgi:type I restriction enzyme, R subunit